MSLPVRALSRDMDKRNTAWCDEMEPKNRFSTLLEHLMSVVALKHYVVAQALQYDVSYISKWIGGKALPAEKSAEDVLRRLSPVPGGARRAPGAGAADPGLSGAG